MKVKKYVAQNMAEAMKQIRQDLGDEAVILNSKVTHTGGWLGLFKKKKLEVIAALDMERKPSKVFVKEKKREQHPQHPNQKSLESNNNLHEEINEIKRMVQDITINQPIQMQNYPESIQIFCEKLYSQDLNMNIIHSLGDELLKQWRSSQVDPSEQEISEWAKKHFTEILSQYDNGGSNVRKKYINLVGPTGVGKTTTLAKIAAGEVINNRKKIAFITTDTYRIAAIEQLKTYANLLNVPVEVVYKLEDFQKAVKKYEDYDHVFIDTAGRNYREMKYIEELQKLIDFKQDIETFLTLSMTMKERDIQGIIKNFEILSIDKFIFTKLDETSTYGTLVNIIVQNKKGVAYLTYGQDVPDDVEVGSSQAIIKHLFEGIDQ
ncbi:flagellar biosynthesis protein FlhF [Heyndrickxia oleronia]|jgi:flagellar biosynthesis protein FlhF|uniref:flagellar biosynthesis protein FlhF n=1 Tax=Heyndrickxia oleronia TaxID=38875 RepID=UPI00242AAEC2|nr:flagellar biosynthesis protein FlhF [Heyndrickxia oleronia]MCI1589603.1 flagellar biosynthesis protein FlhF [Heyndrickxia oleronia]MCI1613306.1 flagellar biosynthesis protein FlhF [Heyndrickxia oleronia]MCI1744632.1 flagellar biosynthesis protein FlhF [Heyndrickxia oleronia]MCI1761255.1 flagellar biosynthesis protein FlhF [Heyndrickxia oleronia]